MNQRAFDNQRSTQEWVSAAEAARLLGVKRTTVYAYAARGLFGANTQGPGTKARYARAAVERLKVRANARSGHAAVAAGALRFGEPVLDTEVSTITPEGPLYRGRNAVELAQRGWTFEQVAELLWQLPNATWPEPSSLSVEHAGRPADGILRLAAMVTTLGLHDPLRFSTTPDTEYFRARQVITTLTVHAGTHTQRALAGKSVADRLFRSLTGRAPTEAELRILDACLVLSAEHELNASAFAARVTASTGADSYACMTSALCALSGPLHGRATDRVEALLDEAEHSDAMSVVRRKVDLGEALAGFWAAGAYSGSDPRCVALLSRVQSDKRLKRVRSAVNAMVDAAAKVGAPAPSVDFGLVAVARGLELPSGSAGLIMSIGRMAGVMAHVVEQRRTNAVIRPRARFVASAGP